jgi:thioredoxin 1
MEQSLQQWLKNISKKNSTDKQEEKEMKLLDKTNFSETVLEGSGVCLVDFFIESCEPCKALMPAVEELEGTYNELPFYKLDTMKARRLAIKQQIMGLPVIAIYKDGAKVEELVKDDATKENIELMIKKYI